MFILITPVTPFLTLKLQKGMGYAKTQNEQLVYNKKSVVETISFLACQLWNKCHEKPKV